MYKIVIILLFTIILSGCGGGSSSVTPVSGKIYYSAPGDSYYHLYTCTQYTYVAVPYTKAQVDALGLLPCPLCLVYHPPVLPLSFTGTGPEATELFELDFGLLRWECTHEGEGNIIVWLMNDDGEKNELFVNEIGVFAGSGACGITEPGEYLLTIEADGPWSLTLE